MATLDAFMKFNCLLAMTCDFDRGSCDSLAIRFHVYTLVPKYYYCYIVV